MSKYSLVFLLFSTWSIVSYSQDIGDYDYVFSSLTAIEAHADQVINVELVGKKLKEIPPILYELPYLENLDLSKNQISLLPSSLKELRNLKSLNLSKNNISILPPQIGSLNKLEILDLSKNKIKVLPEEIGGMKSLKEFHIWNNQLTVIPSSIQKLRNLKMLNLRGMFIEEENETQLTNWLPETDIYFSHGCACKR